MAKPLTLLMPVLPGVTFVDLTFSLAVYVPKLHEALRSIGTVHYARTLLLDASSPNLQPGMHPNPSYVLAILTEYDGDFDLYVQDFVDEVAPFFDAMLKFVVGGEALIPITDNVEAFANYLKMNDASQHFPNDSPAAFWEAYPYTVKQILANR